MSVHRILLSSSQNTFLDEGGCRAIFSSEPWSDNDDRPHKRRKLEQGPSDWCYVLELIIRCEFTADLQPTSSVTKTFPIDVEIHFDEPIVSIANSGSEQPMFSFVCDESQISVFEKISWVQKLARKNTISKCLRLSSSVSFSEITGYILSAMVCLQVYIRFDRHLAGAPKLSPRDRIALLDYAFEKPVAAVDAEKFYANIGRLPKDYIYPDDEKLFQPASIQCRLFPFQLRAVAWMLEREGILLHRNSSLYLHRPEGDCNLHPLWEMAKDLDGNTVFLNRHLGLITLDKSWPSEVLPVQNIFGGILAEVSYVPYRLPLQIALIHN